MEKDISESAPSTLVILEMKDSCLRYRLDQQVARDYPAFVSPTALTENAKPDHAVFERAVMDASHLTIIYKKSDLPAIALYRKLVLSEAIQFGKGSARYDLPSVAVEAPFDQFKGHASVHGRSEQQGVISRFAYIKDQSNGIGRAPKSIHLCRCVKVAPPT